MTNAETEREGRGWIGIAALGLGIALPGCVGSQEGRLFGVLDARSTSVFGIETAASGSSPVYAVLPDGVACHGRVARAQTSESEDPEAPSVEEGLAVLVCGRSKVLHCRLAYRQRRYTVGRCTTNDHDELIVLF